MSEIVAVDAEEIEAKLMSEISHQADLLLVVRPLSTGYSKDIHGRISILHQNNTIAGAHPLPELLHFVVNENGVKVFVPGAH